MTNLPETVAAANPKFMVNAALETGGVSALIPRSLDDTFRLAKALAASGDMVPKHFQEKPDAIMAAILRGMEIGLAPMQALSNIAVINGRASLWGDALPALMQRAGHSLDCEVTGEGDQMKAVATLIRGDTGQKIVREFSAADAKAAGLWGKAGPWQSYKPRMLSMRARSWACRDGAADALMGLQVVEEMQDAPPIRDVTPKTSPAMSALLSKAKPQVDQVLSAEDTPQDDGTHWTDDEPEDCFPGSDAFTAGAEAFNAGKPARECPFDQGTDAANDWCGGWHGARRAAE